VHFEKSSVSILQGLCWAMPTALNLAKVCIKHSTTILPSLIPPAPTAPSPLEKKETQTQINLLGKEVRAAESIVAYYRRDLPREAPGLSSAAAAPGGRGSAGRLPRQGCSEGGLLQLPPKKKAAA